MTEAAIIKYKGSVNSVLFADNWNELSAKMLLYIGEYWESWRLMARGDQNMLKVKALLVMEAVCDSVKLNKKVCADVISMAEPMKQYELCEAWNWLFEVNTLTKCPVVMIESALNGKEVMLYAPSDGLGNILCLEMHFADKMYLQYNESGNEDFLNLLIGCIYRPRKVGSEEREAFDNYKVKLHLKTIEKMDYAVKMTILLWFIGCRGAIVNQFKSLFGGKGSNNEGWMPIITEMSGYKYGNFREVAQESFLLILTELKRMQEVKMKSTPMADAVDEGN